MADSPGLSGFETFSLASTCTLTMFHVVNEGSTNIVFMNLFILTDYTSSVLVGILITLVVLCFCYKRCTNKTKESQQVKLLSAKRIVDDFPRRDFLVRHSVLISSDWDNEVSIRNEFRQSSIQKVDCLLYTSPEQSRETGSSKSEHVHRRDVCTECKKTKRKRALGESESPPNSAADDRSENECENGKTLQKTHTLNPNDMFGRQSRLEKCNLKINPNLKSSPVQKRLLCKSNTINTLSCGIDREKKIENIRHDGRRHRNHSLVEFNPQSPKLIKIDGDIYERK